MSEENSKQSESETQKKPSTDETTVITLADVIPPIADAKASLRTSIKSAVQAANGMLGSLEEVSDTVAGPAMETYRHLEKRGEFAAKEVTHYYDRRKSFGPHLVIGSSLLVGGIVGLRRGRVPAIASGSVAGFITYLGVYEVELHRLSDVVFGTQDK